jgi:hypothetical protein
MMEKKKIPVLAGEQTPTLQPAACLCTKCQITDNNSKNISKQKHCGE